MAGLGIDNHEFIRMDEMVLKVIDYMHMNVNRFEGFIQMKKSLQHSNMRPDYLMHFISEDRIFDDSHGRMISRLTSYRTLANYDKIMTISRSLHDFDKWLEIATKSYSKILGLMKNVHRSEV